ncbi:uncharacterized protein LOC126795481 [Argentina anserina]|uniref:uncharacterized protein LOC126795481 n=1 Tax=Argentina anserina TaxID=57926 RepID=UPI00217676FE|nr:uncharacterized protein LOC126795481 [Potentilla anserina]
MQKWDLLKSRNKGIEAVLETRALKDVEDNRLRLKASIESVRLLAKQIAPFRGHDESKSSLNQGYFLEVLNSFTRMSVDVERVVLNVPGNTKYTSPTIQKQILNIIGHRVRTKIHEKVDISKYCILVDKAKDVSGQEHMTIILRFVDSQGLIRERFFKIVSVLDTTSQTLKNGILKVLTMYDLQVKNMRGQWYDGASNMRSIYNGLQALFLEECPCAYFVHCYTHRLQLTLNVTAQGVHEIWQFFITLSLIVNFVDASAKRHSTLIVMRKEEITELVACGELQTGSGANQICTLQRAVKKTLNVMIDQRVEGEAEAILKALRSFDFVLCLLLMNKNDKVTPSRDEEWDGLLKDVTSICEIHELDMPDLSARYKSRTGRDCQQNDFISVEHHYRVSLFNFLIDYQLSELNRRYSDQASELLTLSSTLDSRGRSFKTEDVCNLAKKFYPVDFDDGEMCSLQLECAYYEMDMHNDLQFKKLESIAELSHTLAQTRKSEFYLMLYRLICLVLNIHVSSTTTEKTFSGMNIIKNRLRNKMEDEFLDDCMLLYGEKEYTDSIDN